MRNVIVGRRGPKSPSLHAWYFAVLSVIASSLLAQSTAISANEETQVIDGWGKTTAPRSDAIFESKDAHLTITVARDGSEGPANSDDFQAPRVVQSVEGDFAIEVTIGGSLPLPEKPDAADPAWQAYVSGGLLVWIDGKNYVRLERASFVRGTSKHYYANFEMWSDGISVRMGQFADLVLRDKKLTRLRLECRSGEIRALAAQSETWHELGIAKPKMPSQVLAGVHSVNASGKTTKVTFSKLNLLTEFEPIDCDTSSKIELLPLDLQQEKEAKHNAITRANLHKMRELSKRIRTWEKLSREDRKQVIDESIVLLTSEVGISNQMATAGVRAISAAAIASGDLDLGIGVFDQAIEQVAKAGMPRADVVGTQLKSWREAIRKELTLLGEKLELNGKLLSGDSLDWEQYEGKVVLVDFWASWCGPCRAEMPNVKKQYDKYHDAGFEVVGICLDQEREKAEQYIQANDLPWPSLFEDGVGWKHPMARKYHVSGIPKAILLDRHGTVVSISARGEQLPRLLQKHLRPEASTDDLLGSLYRMLLNMRTVIEKQLAKQLFEDADKLPDDVFLITCRRELPKRISAISGMSQKERSELVPLMKRQLELAARKGLTDVDVSTALGLAVALDRSGSTELARAAANAFQPIIENERNAKYRPFVESLENLQRRLGVLGSKLELTGSLIDGSDFDWSEYRGKVLLVDFWATWCGPCVAEIPNLKEQLEFYGDRGFDIVGISLDSDRAKLEKFIQDNDISWANLHDKESGRSHPIAKKYSIRSIPTAWLVDREGKVIHLNARGHELGLELARLIGPRSGEAGKLAVEGKWAEASEAMKRFVTKHDSAKHFRGLVSAQILAGDLEGYRATCKSLWQQVDRRGPYDQANIVIYCCLVPDSGVDPKKLIDVTDKLLGRMWNNNFEVALVMASYRAGDFKRCDAKLQPNASPLQQFVDACFTSMAAYRQGERDKAEKEFANAEALFAQHFTSIDGYRTGRHMTDHWMSCAMAQIVLQEARNLVQDSSAEPLSRAAPTLQPLSVDPVVALPRSQAPIEMIFASPRFQASEKDSELARLHKERLRYAVAVARIQQDKYSDGSGSLDSVADALDRVLSSYLSIPDTGENQAEVLRQFQEHLFGLDQLVQTRVQVGAGNVADAALARTITLSFASRLLDERPELFSLNEIQGKLFPARMFSDQRNSVDEPAIERPLLKLNDSISNLSSAVPAIVQPHQVKMDGNRTRLPILRYNAAALRMAVLNSSYLNGSDSLYAMSGAVDGLISAAFELDLPAKKFAGLLEQEVLFWEAQRRFVLERNRLGGGSSGSHVYLDYRLFDAALRLTTVLETEGLTSDLSLAELIAEDRAVDPPSIDLVSSYPNLFASRKLPKNPEKQLIRSLQIAKVNAAAKTFAEAHSQYLMGANSNAGPLVNLNTLVELALAIESDPEKRRRLLSEAVNFAKQIERAARSRQNAGVGRRDNVAMARFVRAEIEIQQLTMK